MSSTRQILAGITVGTVLGAVLNGVKGMTSGVVGAAILNYGDESGALKDVVTSQIIGSVATGAIGGGIIGGFTNESEVLGFIEDRFFKNVYTVAGGSLVAAAETVASGLIGYAIWNGAGAGTIAFDKVVASLAVGSAIIPFGALVLTSLSVACIRACSPSETNADRSEFTPLRV